MRWLLFGCSLLVACGSQNTAPTSPSSPGRVRASAARKAPGPLLGPAPFLGLGKASIGCLEPSCFSHRGFPAISQNGSSIVVLRTLPVRAALGGSLEFFTAVRFDLLRGKDAALMKSLPLIRFGDVEEANTGARSDCCTSSRESDRDDPCDPRLCPDDPELRKQIGRKLKARFKSRVAQSKRILSGARYEALVPIPLAGKKKAAHGLTLEITDQRATVIVRIRSVATKRVRTQARLQCKKTDLSPPLPESYVQAWYSARHKRVLIGTVCVDWRAKSHEALYAIGTI